MIRVDVRVAALEVERALDVLLPLVPGGVHQRDLVGLTQLTYVGHPGEVPDVAVVTRALGPLARSVTAGEAPDDPIQRRLLFHEDRTVAGRFRLRPAWAPPRAQSDGLVDLVIDEGMAFGTGAHPTTQMCLELLLTLAPGGGFADLGCGTGILTVAAARLGWSPLTAVDYDPAGIEAAQRTFVANGVQAQARQSDLLAQAPPFAPTLVANVAAPVLLSLADRLEAAPAQAIVSGIGPGDEAPVTAAFARHGLAPRARRQTGEWVAMALTA